MTEAEIFDNETRDRGGLLMTQPILVTGFRKTCYERIARYRSSVKALRPFPNILHDFCSNTRINAFARWTGTHQIIGISGAVFWLMNEFFNHMMAQKYFRSDVGDPSGDLDQQTLLFDYIPDIRHWENQPAARSQDSVRRNKAFHFANLACMFVFEHELTHVLHGHTHYLPGRTFSDELFPDHRLHNLECQTLEMLADQGALYRTSYMLLDLYRYRSVWIPYSFQLLMIRCRKFFLSLIIFSGC